MNRRENATPKKNTTTNKEVQMTVITINDSDQEEQKFNLRLDQSF